MSIKPKETPGKYLLDNQSSIAKSLKVQWDCLEVFIRGTDIGEPSPTELKLVIAALESYEKSDKMFASVQTWVAKVAAREGSQDLTRQQKRQYQRDLDKLRDKVVALWGLLEKTNETLEEVRDIMQARTKQMRARLDKLKEFRDQKVSS